ncbi:TrbC family F-type conjugative pilus assembly protein [Parasutterella secunda]|uniref:Type-F conjugative transfer system pilin assembly protein TrbC n=1 Tax=Parasutterella secunda TaxID=626947 RepID=A0ABS2GT54_9BURK|nr:TrbC family F-type conjugative pilus assembly protein [Parasutterella secunda]MBM6929005.1 hypothetical protein [Parasutterella secunda]
MKKLLILTALLSASTPYALTPLEVQNVINEAQQTVQSLPESDEETIAIDIAVSLSMPRASLIRLGQDAKDAGLALSFRGVGRQIEPKPHDKPRTILETYGKGLVARHLSDFKFLTDLGVSVKIDPVLFNRQGIDDVPQILLMPVCKSACDNKKALFVARGDVTLRYALDYLAKDIEVALKKEPHNAQSIKASEVVKNALNRLGDRP